MLEKHKKVTSPFKWVSDSGNSESWYSMDVHRVQETRSSATAKSTARPSYL